MMQGLLDDDESGDRCMVRVMIFVMMRCDGIDVVANVNMLILTSRVVILIKRRVMSMIFLCSLLSLLLLSSSL